MADITQRAPVVDCFRAWQQAQQDVAAAQEMLRDPDPEMQDMAGDELRQARERTEALELR